MIKIIVLCFLLMPSYVLAQEEIPKVLSMRKGQIVPFDGNLLNAAAIAKIIVEKEYAQKHYELNKDYELNKQKMRFELEINNLKIELEIAKKKQEEIVRIKERENNRLIELLKKSEQNNNYKIWWVAAGIFSGAALTVGTTYAINHR